MVLSGREKATIFLSLLGPEVSSRILRYLPEELADLIATGVNQLPNPSPEALSAVIEEFNSYLALPETVEARRPAPAPSTPTGPRKSFNLLLYERPQLVAFLLSLLSEAEKNEALSVVSKERPLIEELIMTRRDNVLGAKIEAKLREMFQGKIF